MSKKGEGKSPMTTHAAGRIQSAGAKNGQAGKGSFAARAQSSAARNSK